MVGYQRIRFLKNIGFSSSGYETTPVQDDDTNLYYYDEAGRYCYLPKESEGIDFKYIESKHAKEVLEFHGFESLYDCEEYVMDAIGDLIDKVGETGEFQGTIKITVEYIEEDGN